MSDTELTTLREEVERLREGLARAEKERTADDTRRFPRIITEKNDALREAAEQRTRAFAAEQERDEWRTKALDVEKHPAIMALKAEKDAAEARVKELEGAVPSEQERIDIEDLRCDQCDNIAGHRVDRRKCGACADVKAAIQRWRAIHALAPAQPTPEVKP